MGARTQPQIVRQSVIAGQPAGRDPLEWTRSVCVAALHTGGLRRVAEILADRGHTSTSIAAIVAAVSEPPQTLEPVNAIRSAAGGTLEPGDLRSFERFLLLTAALESVDRLPALPVSDDVKRLLGEEYRFYASPPAEHAHRFAVGTASFTAMCKTASLRRFPGGQFDWEVGGISRSDILKSSPGRLLSTVAFAVIRMRGLQPVFFSHLNWRRPNSSLLEVEANRSYYRMARALELQPDVKGFAACSWFRSPGTHRVSPNLAWLSRVIVENGGFVVEAGADSPESGVLQRSRTRRRLYDTGQFKPTKGLVMWPREPMIAWAARHPEFGP